MLSASGLFAFAVAGLLQASPPAPASPPPPEELARQGLQAAAAGNLDDAARLLDDARAFLPHSTAIRVELAKVLARKGQLPSAMALLRDHAVAAPPRREPGPGGIQDRRRVPRDVDCSYCHQLLSPDMSSPDTPLPRRSRPNAESSPPGPLQARDNMVRTHPRLADASNPTVFPTQT
jgi:hypothetical protein